MNPYWRSYYLYYAVAADPVLTELVQPYLLLLKNRLPADPAFFFVRYFEDGYHIRLRIRLDDASAATAEPWLEQAIQQYTNRSGQILSLRQAAYVPETARYGNAATIRLAEHQFEASSRIVLHWLCGQAGDAASGRHLQALKLHLAFFRALSLSREQLLAVCDSFIEGWLPRLYQQAEPIAIQREMVLNAFESSYRKYEPILQQTLPEYWTGLGQTTEPEWAAYLAVNSTVAAGYKTAGLSEYQLNEVFGSLLHMTNNRLGLQNREEAFSLYLVRKSLLLLSIMITPDQQTRLEAGLQEIVAQLLEQVQQDAGGCFWNTIHHEPLSDTFSYRINSSIWNGTAGIACFFLALSEHTADPSFLEMAERAANRLLQEPVARAPIYYNLYDGITGTIYLFLKLFEKTGKARHLATAQAMALQHGPAILAVTVEDLLDGIAGNLFVLTLLYHHSRESMVLAYVNELILKLVSSARPGARGMKWGRNELSVDALCGFSHGAAGIAHVLLQVGTYFNNPELIWLAEQAMLYEDTYYDAGINNWMDLRWTSAHLRLPHLFEWEKKTFMPVNFDINAWAHGAAGIGITRLHAIRLTGNRDHLPAIEAVLKRCLSDCRHQTKRSHLLFSGYGGLAEFFLLYSQVAGKATTVFEEAVAIGLAAIDQGRTHAHRGWGTGGHEDQGLMTGTAGIGFLLLRLLSRGSLDSILHPCLPLKVLEPAPIGSVSQLSVRRLVYQRYFPETIAALAGYVPDADTCFSASDTAACAGWLRNRIRSLPDTVGTRLHDQWAVEATALALWRTHRGSLCFYTRLTQLKEQLPRYDEAADRFSQRQFSICPFVRILQVEAGWQVLYSTEDWICRLTIGHFPGLVLHHLQSAHSVLQLAAKLATVHDLPETVLAEQLVQQYKALLEQFLIYEPGI